MLQNKYYLDNTTPTGIDKSVLLLCKIEDDLEEIKKQL